jgi:hypothetical protein
VETASWRELCLTAEKERDALRQQDRDQVPEPYRGPHPPTHVPM